MSDVLMLAVVILQVINTCLLIEKSRETKPQNAPKKKKRMQADVQIGKEDNEILKKMEQYTGGVSDGVV